MKKFTPTLIILLTTVSLIGLFYIQWDWLNNASKIEDNKFDNQIENSSNGIKMGLRSQLAQLRGLNPNVANYDDYGVELYFWSSVNLLPNTQINEVIEQELAKNDIHLPFEFCIVSRGFIENKSDNFDRNAIDNAAQFSLTSNNNYVLILYIKKPNNYNMSKLAKLYVFASFFTILIILSFFLTIKTMLTQKKLSEIKTDFINNMTHEFKTPLSSISISVNALGMDKVIKNPEMHEYYRNIIKDENKRMNEQVEKILEAAKIGKIKINLDEELIEANPIIDQIANNFEPQINIRNGVLTRNICATHSTILADQVHFSNIIFNLMDNAVKYSQGVPNVRIETFNSSKGYLGIRIKDSGIGMDKETQKRIFEKFYRAHTGNVHNVKGFGLGLSYVKSIVDAHHGKIKVESSLGKGSTFTIELPLYKNK